MHRGVPNVSERLRMSFDARFQRVGDPISPDTLLPFTRPQTWEEIYAGWTADSPYRYYWEGHSLDLKEYDPSYHRKRDAMAMEMAEEGDPRARSALQRIVARDQDPGRPREGPGTAGESRPPGAGLSRRPRVRRPRPGPAASHRTRERPESSPSD